MRREGQAVTEVIHPPAEWLVKPTLFSLPSLPTARSCSQLSSSSHQHFLLEIASPQPSHDSLRRRSRLRPKLLRPLLSGLGSSYTHPNNVHLLSFLMPWNACFLTIYCSLLLELRLMNSCVLLQPHPYAAALPGDGHLQQTLSHQSSWPRGFWWG